MSDDVFVITYLGDTSVYGFNISKIGYLLLAAIVTLEKLRKLCESLICRW